MPIQPPAIDKRKFADLIAEALARIPVHNPEWTNFNKSDPGVTILEVAAFLLENDIYVANQIPERQRRKFLELLRLPLQPGTPSRGLVSFTNERGPLQTLTLNDAIEVRAGDVPFRTTAGLDVLPVEAPCYFKRRAQATEEQLAQYRLLYDSHRAPGQAFAVDLYETAAVGPQGWSPEEAIDRSLWIALLARPTEANRIDDVRRALAGKTLSLGVVPRVLETGRTLSPVTGSAASGDALRLFVPDLPAGGALSESDRQPRYRALTVRGGSDVLASPGTVEVTLPATAAELGLWRGLQPLESGTGDFPPSLDDTEQAERVVTWLRVRSPVALAWIGVNCAEVTQRARVVGEVLSEGTGEPDQVRSLSRSPVLPGTVRLSVTPDLPDALPLPWQEIDDLLAAGPEVVAPDPRSPPGRVPGPPPPSQVFVVDAEAGQLRFGDGARGARPPRRARLRVDYDYGLGRRGNVGARAVDKCPALPSGWRVSNPVSTWGGADAESVEEGEKQIPRFLQHRDRLVSTDDFETLTLRTPGIEVGRVEVLPAFHPDLSPSLPGDAAGVVTVMVIPRYDADRPDAPLPDRRFLDAVACWLEPRRLITTELVLRGPVYVPIQVAVAIEVVPGASQAEVREAVKREMARVLSPLPPAGTSALAERAALLTNPSAAERGYRLGRTVSALELQSVASRVNGVLAAYPVRLYRVTEPTTAGGARRVDALPEVPMNGLELPRLVGVEVGIGADSATPDFADQASTPPTTFPVPVVPQECR